MQWMTNNIRLFGEERSATKVTSWKTQALRDKSGQQRTKWCDIKSPRRAGRSTMTSAKDKWRTPWRSLMINVNMLFYTMPLFLSHWCYKERKLLQASNAASVYVILPKPTMTNEKVEQAKVKRGAPRRWWWKHPLSTQGQKKRNVILRHKKNTDTKYKSVIEMEIDETESRD